VSWAVDKRSGDISGSGSKSIELEGTLWVGQGILTTQYGAFFSEPSSCYWGLHDSSGILSTSWAEGMSPTRSAGGDPEACIYSQG
jgi:hypothetical protein